MIQELNFKKIFIHATVFGIIFCFTRLYLQKIWTNEKIPNKKNMFLISLSYSLSYFIRQIFIDLYLLYTKK